MVEEMDNHYSNRLTNDNLMKAQVSNSIAFGDKTKNYSKNYIELDSA